MVARAFDDATATLVCRLRVRTSGVSESHADVTLNLSDASWKTYTPNGLPRRIATRSCRRCI